MTATRSIPRPPGRPLRPPTVMEELAVVREALRKAAGPDTFFGSGVYDPLASPLCGHCGVVAVLIQRVYGGVILRGTVGRSQHFWNRLPCGRHVDLTSCQYGGDGLRPITRRRRSRGKPVATPTAAELSQQYYRFADRVRALIVRPRAAKSGETHR